VNLKNFQTPSGRESFIHISSRLSSWNKAVLLNAWFMTAKKDTVALFLKQNVIRCRMC